MNHPGTGRGGKDKGLVLPVAFSRQRHPLVKSGAMTFIESAGILLPDPEKLIIFDNSDPGPPAFGEIRSDPERNTVARRGFHRQRREESHRVNPPDTAKRVGPISRLLPPYHPRRLDQMFLVGPPEGQSDLISLFGPVISQSRKQGELRRCIEGFQHRRCRGNGL